MIVVPRLPSLCVCAGVLHLVGLPVTARCLRVHVKEARLGMGPRIVRAGVVGVRLLLPCVAVTFALPGGDVPQGRRDLSEVGLVPRFVLGISDFVLVFAVSAAILGADAGP